jgi:6-hydroxynicotinate 3-monooxygenase
VRRSLEIALIGAGLGGMTAAGLLQRAGFRVKVYEQASAFSRIGAGIHLTANVMKVMRRLGIERRLSDIGLHPDAFVSRAWDTGDILFELPLDAASEARYGAAYINVHRGDLHDVLYTSLEPNTVAFGHKLRSLDATARRVKLEFENGIKAESDIVIGADGVHSTVREFLLGPEKPRFSGHIAHRAVFPTALLNGLPIRACTKWWGPRSHVLVYYMTHTREEVYVVSSVPAPSWDSTQSYLPCSRESFVAAFEGYHPELRQVVAAAPTVIQWGIFDREPVDCWSRGPLVLIGDASHPLRPYMAAGAAMAIEDAAVLARCISEIGRDDPTEAFLWYEANRMPRTNKVQRISVANTWLRGPTNPDWLFLYDACSVPLFAPGDVPAEPA